MMVFFADLKLESLAFEIFVEPLVKEIRLFRFGGFVAWHYFLLGVSMYWQPLISILWFWQIGMIVPRRVLSAEISPLQS